MKQGTTPTIEFKLDIEISNVTEVYFTFTDELAYKGTSDDETTNYLLQKNYPDDATFEDEKFKLPLTQEETDLLTNTFFVEAQVICDKAVVKSDVKKINMPHTLWTTYVDDNESDGQSEVIHLSFSDYVRVEGGGGSDNYNDLSNKPQINNITLQGNKTPSQLGLYTKDEVDTKLSNKQNLISGGNGIDVSSDTVSVDLATLNNIAKFYQGKLTVAPSDIGLNEYIRQALTQSGAQSEYRYPLASKSYVDNLMSGATKWEFVSQLPTENIDTHTIYFVPKQSAETDNIYDEWVYAIQSRNPDVYDWELLGTMEVDLSNYQTLISSTNKVNADYIDDSESTNKFTNANEKAEWSGKSRVYPAKFVNNE